MTNQRAAGQPLHELGSYQDIYKLYEDGKHRRYGLLFSVNGGGFAVGSLFKESAAAPLLGNLTISQLAVGMAAFTIAMYVDIMVFGTRMRENAGDNGAGVVRGIFSKVGGLVLTVICGVIVLGWVLVLR